ncbi:MAG TPA: putative O-glycosylation ligase, exosortase A system-associated [Chromatiaceae bacterium]|nr:putative O-glycosylation ligase, exosortase A system-associated [Chromatiaceae bacterium]
MGLRDFVVLMFTLACIGFALRKAWWGVLALAVFSYLNPHAYAWGPVRTLPLYQILFIVVAIKTLMETDRQSIPKDWRITVFLILWFYFFLTTTQALVPTEAWNKFWFVTKVYLPFIFTLILINTREKLYYLIVTIASSIGIVAVKGGIFAITHGFSARIYGPPATQFEENNAFAVAVLINIPLLVLWYRETTNAWIKRGILVAIPLHYVCAVSSWSRGAMIAMAAMTFVLIWNSRRKWMIVPLFIVGAYFTVQALPEDWFHRMSTIETYETDKSAQGRLEVWRDGWNYALEHPFLGSGFEGWIWVTQRDWHSSYIEILAEHGFIAFGLWFSLLFGTLVSLTRLPKKVKGVPELKWVENYSYMLRASLIAYATGTAFLGLSYWDLLYHLVFLAVLTKQFALKELREYQQRKVVAQVVPSTWDMDRAPGAVNPAR